MYHGLHWDALGITITIVPFPIPGRISILCGEEASSKYPLEVDSLLHIAKYLQRNGAPWRAANCPNGCTVYNHRTPEVPPDPVGHRRFV